MPELTLWLVFWFTLLVIVPHIAGRIIAQWEMSGGNEEES